MPFLNSRFAHVGDTFDKPSSSLCHKVRRVPFCNNQAKILKKSALNNLRDWFSLPYVPNPVSNGKSLPSPGPSRCTARCLLINEKIQILQVCFPSLTSRSCCVLSCYIYCHDATARRPSIPAVFPQKLGRFLFDFAQQLFGACVSLARTYWYFEWLFHSRG